MHKHTIYRSAACVCVCRVKSCGHAHDVHAENRQQHGSGWLHRFHGDGKRRKKKKKEKKETRENCRNPVYHMYASSSRDEKKKLVCRLILSRHASFRTFSLFIFLEIFSSGTCRCIRRSSRSYKCRERRVWGGLTAKCVASEEEPEPRRCKVLEGSHSRLCIARNANATEEVDKEGAALQTSGRALRTRPADKVAYSEGQSSYPKKQFPSANSTTVPTKSSAGTQGKRKKKHNRPHLGDPIITRRP